MASRSTAGCQSNGEKAPGHVASHGRPYRYQSESETDIVLTAKSLSRLCSRNEEERAAALEQLSESVLLCLGLDRPGSTRLGQKTLLHLLRLSLSCPIQEVREKVTELLRAAQVTLLHNTALPMVLPDHPTDTK